MRIVARRVAAAWCDVGRIVGTVCSVYLIAGKQKWINARRVAWCNASWSDVVSIRLPVRIVARRVSWQKTAWCDVGRIVGTGSSVSLILLRQPKWIDARRVAWCNASWSDVVSIGRIVGTGSCEMMAVSTHHAKLIIVSETKKGC